METHLPDSNDEVSDLETETGKKKIHKSRLTGERGPKKIKRNLQRLEKFMKKKGTTYEWADADAAENLAISTGGLKGSVALAYQAQVIAKMENEAEGHKTAAEILADMDEQRDFNPTQHVAQYVVMQNGLELSYKNRGHPLRQGMARPLHTHPPCFD